MLHGDGVRSDQPRRPKIVRVSATQAELKWDPPAGYPRPTSYCVLMQQGGDSSAWSTVVENTGTHKCIALVEDLEPESWYVFRVSAVDPFSGAHGRGSAPSEPCKTIASIKKKIALQDSGLHARAPNRKAVQQMASGAAGAAALVVARGADTTPPLTEEESAQRAAAVTHAMEAATLRKFLLEWDKHFEQRKGRAATDEERRTSPRRIAKLEEYSSLRREWQALGLPEPDSETLASGGSGGVMGVEQGALALRMAAEAHSMYLRVLMERCASLPVSDVLSALGSDLLDGATRLFSRFDADVDGLLSQAEFSHLYSFLSEQTTAAASASEDEQQKDWRVAFRRADIGALGVIDLNSLVLYLQRTGQMEVLRRGEASAASSSASPPFSRAARAHAEAAAAQAEQHQASHLHSAENVITAARDTVVLADHKYLERLIEQSQSAKGKGYELDRLADHRMLLKAMRLFRHYDHQRRGTLDPFEFATMVAPKLELALERQGAAADAKAAAVRAKDAERRRLAGQQKASLGDMYLALATEAAQQQSSNVMGSFNKTSKKPSSFTKKAIGEPSWAARVEALGEAVERVLTDTLCASPERRPVRRPEFVPDTAAAAPAPAATSNKEQGTSSSSMAADIACGVAAVESAQHLFAYADSTGSGALDFNEFVSLLASGAITRVADGGTIGGMDAAGAAIARKAEMGEVGDVGRRRAAQAHRARMVDRAIERTGSEASILAQINDPSADEAVRLFAVADADYSGALTLPEFTSALTAASEATYSEAGVTRLIGPAEARLWFASLDREHRGCVDVCQWIQLLVGGQEGAGRSGKATTVDALDPTVLRSHLRDNASDAARIGHLKMRDRAAGEGVDAEAHRQVTAAIKLLEENAGIASPDGSLQGSPLPRRPGKPMDKGTAGGTALEEAAADAAFASTLAERMAASEAKTNAEDERMHKYLSKVVAAAGRSTALTHEGLQTLEEFSIDDLAAALALYERYDQSQDGVLQADEFEEMLTNLSKLHGAKFSTHETRRLFRAADLGNTGSVNMLEVLLLLQQLQLPPIAPAEAEAYRHRLLQNAARSVVRIESDKAKARREGAAQEAAAMQQPASTEPDKSSVLLAPVDVLDEVALLFGRFDSGHKGYLTFNEFAELKDAVAIQSGEEPYSAVELRVLFTRADRDKSGHLDLNELYLHMRGGGKLDASEEHEVKAAPKPVLFTKTTAKEVKPGAKTAKQRAIAEAAAKTEASKVAEEARRAKVDNLLAQTIPILDPALAAAFGEAEMRALAALFADLDHHNKGSLDLPEFRLLLALLAERNAARAHERAQQQALNAASMRSSRSLAEESETAFSELLSVSSKGLDDTPLTVTFAGEEGPTGAPAPPPVPPAFGLREAHTIFRRCRLDANGQMPFATLLKLLAEVEVLKAAAIREGRSALGKLSGRKNKRKGKGKRASKAKARASPATASSVPGLV